MGDAVRRRRATLLNAAGGLEPWQQGDRWMAILPTGGLAFRTRGQPALHRIPVTVPTSGQRVALDHFPEAGFHTSWDSGLARITDRSGDLVEQWRVTNWGRRWGPVDMAPFVGMALWSYASLPVVLARGNMRYG